MSMNEIVLSGIQHKHDMEKVKGESATSDASCTMHLISSLEILQPDTSIDELLMNTITRNIHGHRLLVCTANHWAIGGNVFKVALFRSTYVLSKLFLSIVVILLISFCASSASHKGLFTLTPSYVATAIAFGLELVAVLVGQYLNCSRLFQPAQKHDALHIEESARICQYYLWYCWVIVFVSTVLYCLGGQESATFVVTNVLLLGVGGVCVSAGLAFNLFFLLLDLKVANLLLDQLHILVDKRVVTMSVFDGVREDIKRRDGNSQWASTVVTAACLASAAVLVVIVFSVGQSEIIFGISWIVALTKELLFVCASFWYVAKVNDKADALTLKLSAVSWQSADSENRREEQADLRADLQRVSVYISSQTRPVGFTLLSKRLGWQDVIISGTGFVVTAVVGLIKSSVQQAAVTG